MGIWETEYENYSKKTFVRTSEGKNRKQFKQHVSKGDEHEKMYLNRNEMNACHMVLLHCRCVWVRVWGKLEFTLSPPR